jgi:phosphopantothenoylcysteine decarboxylase / phosphopantothenate---cysteine ligase
LVSGPVNLVPPYGTTVVTVSTALEMREAVMANLREASIIIKAAAVADYRVENPAPQKVKKSAMRMTLDLDPTPDILAEVGKKKGDRLLIGFAAETQNLVAEARRKLESKSCDMVVANLVNQTGTGFESDRNKVTLVLRTGEVIDIPEESKRKVADAIFDQALKMRLALHAAQ